MDAQKTSVLSFIALGACTMLHKVFFLFIVGWLLLAGMAGLPMSELSLIASLLSLAFFVSVKRPQHHR
jgi:hypothetical protein